MLTMREELYENGVEDLWRKSANDGDVNMAFWRLGPDLWRTFMRSYHWNAIPSHNYFQGLINNTVIISFFSISTQLAQMLLSIFLIHGFTDHTCSISYIHFIHSITPTDIALTYSDQPTSQPVHYHFFRLVSPWSELYRQIDQHGDRVLWLLCSTRNVRDETYLLCGQV